LKYVHIKKTSLKFKIAQIPEKKSRSKDRKEKQKKELGAPLTRPGTTRNIRGHGPLTRANVQYRRSSYLPLFMNIRKIACALLWNHFDLQLNVMKFNVIYM
jgi:hypothetical protein